MKKISKEQVIRGIYAVVGVIILSFGSTVLRKGNVGMDPYTAANVAISDLLGLSLGVYQLGINFVLLILIFIFGRKYIGFGTIVNMVLVGFFIDLFTQLFSHFELQGDSLMAKILFLIVGILIFTFAASLYMQAKLGSAPYDAAAPTIVDHTHWQYKGVRIVQDVLFTLIAFLFKGPVGVGTFINAFFTGPLISFWDEKVTRPLIEKTVKALVKEEK